MTIAIVLGAVTLLVAGFVLWPIWINRKQAQSVRSDAKENPSDTNTDSKPDTAPDILGADDEILRDLAVYQDQLSEIDRDIDRGVLTTEQASAARIEVQRRILNADLRIKEQSAAQINIKGSPRLRPLIAGLVALFLIGGVGLYLDLGSPALPDRPIASRTAEINAVRQAEAMDQDRNDVLNRAVSDLSQKLLENPDNIQGWELLGASLMALGRPAEAQTAFLEAVKLSGRDGDYLAMYAESVIRADNGQINAIARGALTEAAQTESIDPRIQYYLGLGDIQDGNYPAAIDRWVVLANNAPADAGWLPMVVSRIQDAALAQGIDIEGRLHVKPSPPMMAGPTEDDVKAAEEMTPQERQEMIASMVNNLAERLEAEPENPEGWARLIRAYSVIGDMDAAQAAYTRATTQFADRSELVARFTTLADELGLRVN